MKQDSTINKDITPSTIYNNLLLIREKQPLIHNISNYVAMQPIANLLLAIGASPLMAHAIKELAEIVRISQALVVNMGTLDERWVASILEAQNAANELKMPVIFDPVGCGASQYRTETAKTILANGVNIVRGNASEIMALVDSDITTKGVDSSHESSQALEAAKYVNKKHDCTVVVSGKIDYIVDNDFVAKNHNGSELFTKVTAMGCSATAIIGAFASVNHNYAEAALNAVATFNIAGEIAAKEAKGPATFALGLQDTLYNLQESDMEILNIT